MRLVLGVDIGVAGALALVTPSGDLLEIAGMPVLHDGPKNRATVNGPLLAEIVYRWHATEAFVEHVSARPGEGAGLSKWRVTPKGIKEAG